MFNDAYKTLPENEFRRFVLDQLFKEFDGGAGTVSPETAREVQRLALLGLQVSGDGWNAAKEALAIASQQNEEGNT